MRTFSLLRGLPVYTKENGKRIGEVVDLCYSNSGDIKGLLLKRGSIFRKAVFIPVKNVSAFGLDGIMLESESHLQTVADNLHPLFEGKNKLLGRPLLTNEGEKLGLLQDVYFHEELGTIIGYECSDGFFADITEGKRVITTNTPPRIGKDAIIVNIT